MDFLEDLNYRTFLWFRDHNVNGLILDRGKNQFGALKTNIASISATGYYLSLLPEFQRLNYLSDAEKMAEEVLRVVLNLVHKDGILNHFINCDTGDGIAEFSCLDTAIFLNGCIVISEFFPFLRKFTDELIERVLWDKFLLSDGFLSLGYLGGYLGPMDLRISEFAMCYFLAGKVDCWRQTKRVGYNLPLFVYYYGLGWFRDEELWLDAQNAVIANKSYYNLNGCWGISAGDTRDGYKSQGLWNDFDGTISPYSALACVLWEDDLTCFSGMVKCYGVCNFSKDWVGEDLVGIDLGSFAINLANKRSGIVWESWEKRFNEK